MITALAIASLLCSQVDAPSRSARLTEVAVTAKSSPEWVKPTVWVSAVGGSIALLPGTLFCVGNLLFGGPSSITLMGLAVTAVASVAAAIVFGAVILGIVMHDRATRGMSVRPLAVAPYLMGALGLLSSAVLVMGAGMAVFAGSLLSYGMLVMTPIVVGPVIVALLLTAGVVGIVNAVRARPSPSVAMEGLADRRGVEVLAF